MIQLAEAVEFNDYRKVPLSARRVYIEVAATRPIDVAVVSEREMKKFDDTAKGTEVDIDWTEAVRNHEREFVAPNTNRYYLLFWNSNEEKNAVVAYKITPLDDER